MAKHNLLEDIRKANALAEMDQRGEIKLSSNELAAVKDVLASTANDSVLIIVNDAFIKAGKQTMEGLFDGK